MKSVVFAALCGMIVLAGCAPSEEPADYVFANGRVYTVNEAQPWAEAVVVRENEIIYVGDTETARGYVGEGTEYVDLGGQMMLPGFVESHLHTQIGAAFGQGLWMAHLDEKQEFLDAVREYTAENPDLPLIMGFGWKPFAFPPEGPSKSDLDAMERIALSFGVSIAIVPLIGLVLSYTLWGFRLYPFLFSLAFFIIAMSAIAWYRHQASGRGESSHCSQSPSATGRKVPAW